MIVVVGAGVTGLALSRELARRAAEHIVLEATDRVGGVIRTRRAGDTVLEAGPQRTRFTPAIRELVEELGIESELLLAPADLPLFVFSRGRLRQVPFTPLQLLRGDLLSWPGRLRLLAEPLMSPAGRNESVAAFLTRGFGPEAYARMLGPLFGGLYGSDPAEMRVRHSLGPLLDDLGLADRSLVLAALRRSASKRRAADACSFRGGLETLPAAMGKAALARIRLATPVRAIRRRGEGYVVEAGGERIDARAVVLTTPAEAASRLLRAVAAPAADALRRLHYNRLAIAYLRSGLDARGLGYQVALGEPLETRGVTFSASLFGPEAADARGTPTRSANGRGGLFTAFLGGSRNPGLVEMPDDWIGEVACNEFRTATGADAEAIAIERVRMPAWDRSWDATDHLDLPPGLHLAANYESRVGIPGRLARARKLAAELTG